MTSTTEREFEMFAYDHPCPTCGAMPDRRCVQRSRTYDDRPKCVALPRPHPERLAVAVTLAWREKLFNEEEAAA